MSVVWAASCDHNFGGMLENSFEHSEIRIAFQQAASEVLQKMHIRKKNEQKFTFKRNFVANGLSIGLPQSSWLCGKRSKRGHPQFAAQILMTSELRRASVFPRISRINTDSK